MLSVTGFLSVASPASFLLSFAVLMPSASCPFPYPSCLCLPLRTSFSCCPSSSRREGTPAASSRIFRTLQLSAAFRLTTKLNGVDGSRTICRHCPFFVSNASGYMDCTHRSYLRESSLVLLESLTNTASLYLLHNFCKCTEPMRRVERWVSWRTHMCYPISCLQPDLEFFYDEFQSLFFQSYLLPVIIVLL